MSESDSSIVKVDANIQGQPLQYVISNDDLKEMIGMFNNYFRDTQDKISNLNNELGNLNSELSNLKSELQNMKKKVQVAGNANMTTYMNTEAIVDSQLVILEKINKIQESLLLAGSVDKAKNYFIKN